MRTAPNQPEAELALLAACLQNSENYLELATRLSSGTFYTPAHAAVWDGLAVCHNDYGSVDITTLRAAVRAQKALRPAESALEGLEAHPVVVDTAGPLTAVTEAYKLRRVYSTALSIANDALDYPTDAQAFLEESESKMFAINDGSLSQTLLSAPEISNDAVDYLERLATLGTDLIGTPTGFVDLDEVTNGLQPGQLIVLGARPGIGKSTLALNASINAARAGHNTIFFSLEMSHLELTMSAYAGLALVDRRRFKNGRLRTEEWSRLGRAIDKFSKLPFWIDDGNCSIAEIESKARRFKARHKDIGLLVIDYLQIMPDVESTNTAQSVAKITRRLKMLAKELACPILLLSQLNRQVENRPDKRPMLSDLREAGAIEADATMVWFLYRETYYNPAEVDRRGIAELILAKNRFGPTGTHELAFVESLPLFTNLDVLI